MRFYLTLDADYLNQHYEGNSYTNVYKLIKHFMIENGFNWKQGSVYFGGENIDAISCVLVIQKLAKKYPWFSTCMKDVRMLRIQENNDLLQAILD